MSDGLDENDGGYSKALTRYNQVKAIYAQSITFDDLDWRHVENYRFLPHRSGVYRINVVIGAIENSLYVGQSRDVRARVSTHMSCRGPFSRVSLETGVPLRVAYIPVDRRRLIEVERYHIHTLGPFFNKEWRLSLESDDGACQSRVEKMIEFIEDWKRVAVLMTPAALRAANSGGAK